MREGVAGPAISDVGQLLRARDHNTSYAPAISDVGQLLRARYHNTSYAPTLFFFSSFR